MQKIQPWFIGLGDVVIACFSETDQRSCSLWRHNRSLSVIMDASRKQRSSRYPPKRPPVLLAVLWAEAVPEAQEWCQPQQGPSRDPALRLLLGPHRCGPGSVFHLRESAFRKKAAGGESLRMVLRSLLQSPQPAAQF